MTSAVTKEWIVARNSNLVEIVQYALNFQP